MIDAIIAAEKLASLLESIRINAICYDRVAECAAAYEGRQLQSRHYQGNLLVDFPLANKWLWSAFANTIQQTIEHKEVTEQDLQELASRVSGIAANARLLISYLSDRCNSEQPLNSIIGDLDGLHRMADILLNDLRQK